MRWTPTYDAALAWIKMPLALVGGVDAPGAADRKLPCRLPRAGQCCPLSGRRCTHPISRQRRKKKKQKSSKRQEFGGREAVSGGNRPRTRTLARLLLLFFPALPAYWM